MEINNAFMNSLTPVQLDFIFSTIYKLRKEKVDENTTNEDNLIHHVQCCPYCKSTHFVKNGFNPKHRQKYLCKDCHHIFLNTTGTIFSRCRSSFKIWDAFMGCEMQGLTLDQESGITGLTRTTCFAMRHRLYSIASSYCDSLILSGLVEYDPTYTKINLKGTKPENMPRISKPRGIHKSSVCGKNLAGLSHHKICILSAVDENDRIRLKIGGLGIENEEKFGHLSNFISRNSILVCDDKAGIERICAKHHFKADVIRSIAGKKNYKSDRGNTLADINEIHSELKELIRHKHGISTRHLQGYMDFLVLRKTIKYSYDIKSQKSVLYMQIMEKDKEFNYRDTCKKEMPISLKEAYQEYHYGIFSEHQLLS